MRSNHAWASRNTQYHFRAKVAHPTVDAVYFDGSRESARVLSKALPHVIFQYHAGQPSGFGRLELMDGQWVEGDHWIVQDLAGLRVLTVSEFHTAYDCYKREFAPLPWSDLVNTRKP